MPSVSMVCVPALCEFSHEGRRYVRGEMVEVSPIAASILARSGKVSLTKPAYQTKVEAPTGKRRYRRRDMRADT
jgi:hypothetical protein